MGAEIRQPKVILPVDFEKSMEFRISLDERRRRERLQALADEIFSIDGVTTEEIAGSFSALIGAWEGDKDLIDNLRNFERDLQELIAAITESPQESEEDKAIEVKGWEKNTSVYFLSYLQGKLVEIRRIQNNIENNPSRLFGIKKAAENVNSLLDEDLDKSLMERLVIISGNIELAGEVLVELIEEKAQLLIIRQLEMLAETYLSLKTGKLAIGSH